MQSAPIPEDEQQRLGELARFEVLDTEADERFDRLTRLVAGLLDVPIALVSLVDRDRQWFKSRVGLQAEETPRDISFCAHAILGDDVFEVADASSDERFSDNPLVTDDPSIRFYAGAPLRTGGGLRVGTLCAIDRVPRTLSAPQRRLLSDLAAIVVDELELQAAASELLAKQRALIVARDVAQRAADAKARLLLAASHELRTPIHAIAGLLELAAEHDLDDDLREVLETTRSSAADLAATVTRLIERGHLDDDQSRIADRPDRQLPGEQPASSADAVATGRVLVVEDNPVNRLLAARQLVRLGYECDTAADGIEALALLEVRRPDAILMDWQMPRMDGLSATARIRERERADGLARVPIVAVTASAMPGDEQRCLDAGMDGFLTKPLGLVELGAVLSRWCGTGPDRPAPPGEHDSSAVGGALDALVSDLGDRAIVASIASTFLRELPSRIDGIVSPDDEGARRALAHTLRSSSGVVGLHDLAALCSVIEADPASPDVARIAELARTGAAAVRAWIEQGESTSSTPRT